MMIDDDTLKQLLRINDELLQLCKWLAERKTRHGNFIPPYTSRRRPYPYSDRSEQEQIAVMQPYKGYSSRAVCCWFIRLAQTGMLAEAFWCQAALVRFSFGGLGGLRLMKVKRLISGELSW
jgi:hypothetical protein